MWTGFTSIELFIPNQRGEGVIGVKFVVNCRIQICMSISLYIRYFLLFRMCANLGTMCFKARVHLLVLAKFCPI